MVTDRVCYEVYNEELGYRLGMYETLTEAIERSSNKCRRHCVYQLDADEKIKLPGISYCDRVIAEIKYDEAYSSKTKTYTNSHSETFDHSTGQKIEQSRKVFLYWLDVMRLYSHVVSVKIVRID